MKRTDGIFAAVRAKTKQTECGTDLVNLAFGSIVGLSKEPKLICVTLIPLISPSLVEVIRGTMCLPKQH